jgi:uncharacterized MAPEG superfamily protein
MTVELQMLVFTAVFTVLLWIPYILCHIFTYGPVPALSYAADGKPLPSWATRLKKAHANAIENLPIFAIAILVAHVMSISTPVTVFAAQTYLAARVLHAVGYASNLPLARTLTFAVGLFATLAIFWEILSVA